MPTINSPALDPCRDMAFWEVSPALKSEHGAESDPASCSSSPGSEADDDAHEQKSNANGNAKRRTTAKPKRLTEERIGQMVRQLALIRDLWVVASPCCLALAFTALPLLTRAGSRPPTLLSAALQTVAELKAELARRDIAATGRKDALRQQLIEAAVWKA